jgi:gas vesicle protein
VPDFQSYFFCDKEKTQGLSVEKFAGKQRVIHIYEVAYRLAAFWFLLMQQEIFQLKNITMSAGKIITGVLIGAAAGAILGILFAPDKGSSTRKKISRKAGDLTDSIKEKFTDLVDTVSEKFETSKKTIAGFAKKGKNKATT